MQRPERQDSKRTSPDEGGQGDVSEEHKQLFLLLRRANDLVSDLVLSGIVAGPGPVLLFKKASRSPEAGLRWDLGWCPGKAGMRSQPGGRSSSRAGLTGNTQEAELRPHPRNGDRAGRRQMGASKGRPKPRNGARRRLLRAHGQQVGPHTLGQAPFIFKQLWAFLEACWRNMSGLERIDRFRVEKEQIVSAQPAALPTGDLSPMSTSPPELLLPISPHASRSYSPLAGDPPSAHLLCRRAPLLHTSGRTVT